MNHGNKFFMMSPALRKRTGIGLKTEMYYCMKCKREHGIHGSRFGFEHRKYMR